VSHSLWVMDHDSSMITNEVIEEEMKKIGKTSSVTIIPEATHHLMSTHPTEFNEIVNKILNTWSILITCKFYICRIIWVIHKVWEIPYRNIFSRIDCCRFGKIVEKIKFWALLSTCGHFQTPSYIFSSTRSIRWARNRDSIFSPKLPRKLQTET